jgi:N-glycosylase/DNA lyase
MDITARLAFPKEFHFGHTVHSHGWCMLVPFDHSPQPLTLSTRFALASGRVVDAEIVEGVSQAAPLAGISATGRLRVAEVTEAAGILGGMLNLGLDLRPLYTRVKRHPDHAWIAKRRAGRMLRGATMFEDAVKMILTTNCSWSLTMTMNTRLVEHFGQKNAEGLACFPSPDAIAGSSERFLRDEIRLGYRAPFVLEFARRCAEGTLDIEAMRASTASTTELYKELRSIKGVGDYAASNLLKLLGRFDRLGLDSWCRAALNALYGNGGAISDADIHKLYAEFEEWAGLVMWLDVTKEWYHRKFPLD